MPIRLWKKIVTPVVNGIRDFKEATTEASSTVTGMSETTAATVVTTSLKRGICVLSIFIAIIPTRLLCQMLANFPEVEFVR